MRRSRTAPRRTVTRRTTSRASCKTGSRARPTTLTKRPMCETYIAGGGRWLTAYMRHARPRANQVLFARQADARWQRIVEL
eukprot:2389034-Pleurochrysis_carterae.AAC.3